jgi:hypothetical protein
MTPATPFVPQQPTNIEEIRRGNLTKLRRHLGSSVPPRVDEDEASDGSGIGKVYGDLSKAPTTTERVSTKEKRRKDERDENLVKSRWLREKKGRRWVEDNYDNIIQSMREL